MLRKGNMNIALKAQNFARHKLQGRKEAWIFSEWASGHGIKDRCAARATIFGYADKVFGIILWLCQAFRLAPVQKTANGTYGAVGGTRLLTFHLILALGGAECAYKFWVTVNLAIMDGNVSLRMFLSISSFLVSFIGWLPSVSLVFVPEATADLLNSLPSVRRRLDERLPKKLGTFCRDVVTSAKVACTMLFPPCMAITAAFALLFFPNLPLSWISLLHTLGLVSPVSYTTNPALICAGLLAEFVTNCLLLTSAAQAFSILVMGVGLLKAFGNGLRDTEVRDMRYRKYMEDLYVEMSVFSRILNVFLKAVTVPIFLCGSLGIIFATFLALRHAYLPVMIHAFCAVSGPAGTLLLFGQIYEGVCVLQVSEEIIGGLLSPTQKYMRVMTRANKNALMKRALAFRAVRLPIGTFGYFSIGVIQGLWEEILNQILFLFSL